MTELWFAKNKKMFNLIFKHLSNGCKLLQKYAINCKSFDFRGGVLLFYKRNQRKLGGLIFFILGGGLNEKS